jgi:hypothetical protein
MIDTDKYERMLKDETYRLDGRNNMMALKLLAEVKQIHEILREAFSTEAKYSGAEYLNMIARVTGLIE